MMAGLNGVLGAVPYGGPWEMPPINELFDMPPLPGTEGWSILGWPISINRTVLMVFLSVIIITALFWKVFGNPRVVPDKLQAALEAVVSFIRERIAIEVIGPEGAKYVPLLTTMFLFIFLNNLFKITPFLMLPPTSRMALPGFLAILSWLIYVGVGLKSQGPLTYLKGIAFPPGVPKPVYVILTPVELLSTLVLRPFTLAIRLFANMVAGHFLVVITLITIHAFLVFGPGLPVGLLALVASPFVFGFELFIISLQAYIFTLLTAVYISSSVHPAH